MLYLYLDESGDLNFDFVTKKPSRHFTICIIAVDGIADSRQLINKVKQSLRYERNKGRNKKGIFPEFKGSTASLDVKKRFYSKIKDIPFEIYSITLNKRRVYNDLARNKNRVYNFVTRQVIDKIPYDRPQSQIQLFVDKSKRKAEIRNFNKYIESNIQGRLDPRASISILHENSLANFGIQAADMFASGIFRKYEREDCSWFNVFQEKVKLDEIYLK